MLLLKSILVKTEIWYEISECRLDYFLLKTVTAVKSS